MSQTFEVYKSEREVRPPLPGRVRVVGMVFGLPGWPPAWSWYAFCGSCPHGDLIEGGDPDDPTWVFDDPGTAGDAGRRHLLQAHGRGWG